MPLHLMRPGEFAEIDQLVGQAEQVHRLQELGLRAGVAVEMVQPGSTCIVRPQNQKLCVRDADLFRIFVRPRDTI
jgi:Fe2+ transport system protein FeoA